MESNRFKYMILAIDTSLRYPLWTYSSSCLAISLLCATFSMKYWVLTPYFYGFCQDTLSFLAMRHLIFFFTGWEDRYPNFGSISLILFSMTTSEVWDIDGKSSAQFASSFGRWILYTSVIGTSKIFSIDFHRFFSQIFHQNLSSNHIDQGCLWGKLNSLITRVPNTDP